MKFPLFDAHNQEDLDGEWKGTEHTQESSLPFTLFVQIEAKTRHMNNFNV